MEHMCASRVMALGFSVDTSSPNSNVMASVSSRPAPRCINPSSMSRQSPRKRTETRSRVQSGEDVGMWHNGRQHRWPGKFKPLFPKHFSSNVKDSRWHMKDVFYSTANAMPMKPSRYIKT